MPSLPHALERIGRWRELRRVAGRMLVAVDFDGTLAPIVERPEDARPLDRAVAALSRLAERADVEVAIVSGRGMADVRARVGLLDLYYAGNHGMEIEGPGVHRLHPEAASARPELDECLRALRPLAEEIAGMQIEDKGLTLSVHYRRVGEEARGRAREAIHGSCAGVGGLRLSDGKMVVEIRPDVDWHKGRATRFLLDSLTEAGKPPPPAIFVGDDRTDEDAFEALAHSGEGEGVVVGDPPPPDTAASSYVRSPEEVLDLLEELAED